MADEYNNESKEDLIEPDVNYYYSSDSNSNDNLNKDSFNLLDKDLLKFKKDDLKVIKTIKTIKIPERIANNESKSIRKDIITNYSEKSKELFIEPTPSELVLAPSDFEHVFHAKTMLEDKIVYKSILNPEKSFLTEKEIIYKIFSRSKTKDVIIPIYGFDEKSLPRIVMIPLSRLNNLKKNFTEEKKPNLKSLKKKSLSTKLINNLKNLKNHTLNEKNINKKKDAKLIQNKKEESKNKKK